MITTAFASFEANLRRGSNTWRARVLASTLVPVLYLVLLQTVFGGAVDSMGEERRLAVGVGLIVFFAAQASAVDSAIPIFSDLNWHRNLFAIRYTPTPPVSLVVGYAGYSSVRAGFIGLLLCTALLVQGAPVSASVLVTLAVSLLCGVIMTCIMVACAASVRSHFQIEGLQRVLPMLVLLTSGALFPIDRLPEVIHMVSFINPFFHGVELARTWLSPQDGVAVLVHTGVISCWLAGTLAVATRQLKRKLAYV